MIRGLSQPMLEALMRLSIGHGVSITEGYGYADTSVIVTAPNRAIVYKDGTTVPLTEWEVMRLSGSRFVGESEEERLRARADMIGEIEGRAVIARRNAGFTEEYGR